jgi:prepilin-type N-terminal cleavage/methylation domain-containing protein
MKPRALTLYPHKAFTFIEILIVILIISTLAVLAAPQFRNTFNTLALNSFVKDIYYLAQYLKESAVSKGVIYCLNIETDKEEPQIYATWRSKDASGESWLRLQGRFAKTYKAPKGVAIFSITPVDKKNIYFYPDGSCDSVAIVFANKSKQQISLIIRGASGAIQIK